MTNSVESKIETLIAGDLADAGYDLVRVMIKGNGKYATLQIMAERQDGVGMTVTDCTIISKAISAKLEADPAFVDQYDLEVSSPGIDRPLVRLADYARYQGHIAKVELNAAIDGHKKFQAKIVQLSGNVIEFTTEKVALNVPFDAIAKAKLVLTDELLKAAASGKVTH